MESDVGSAKREVVKVLIIEDDEEDVLLLRDMLSEAGSPGFELARADRLSTGLEMLGVEAIDVVLSDLNLPDSFGLDTLDRLVGQARRIPIVVLTGLDDETLGIEAVHKGAQDYLVKGQVDGHLLVRTIRYAIGRNRVERELEDAKAFLQNILESSSSISIISTDLEGNILYWNVGAENIFGYKAEEVVGSQKIDILYDHIKETEKTIEAVRSTIFDDKKGVSCEVREVTRDGRKLWINLTLTPRLDDNGQVIGILGIGEDITERKEIDRMKSEIISIVSHELRSPLTSILTALTLVAGGETGDLPEEAERMIDIAHRNSERLLRLINDMLDLKKIESGKMEFHLQPLELMSLVEQAVETNHAYAQQFGVRLALEGDLPGATVNADSDRLMQVLTNLLSNAARYSPPNEAVDVSISRHNGAVRVAVTDHGPGIPKEFRSRIFEQFAQAQSPGAREKGGSGLGLSIAKAIVERMGGQIGFETEVDVGTTFYFDLPEYHPLPARTMSEGKILVMDDEKLVRDITTEMLSNLGYEVTASMHGADAIEVYQEAKESGQPYDAVIVDIVVPGGMGGEETIQKLVEIDPEVKAVVGSGYSNNPIMADFRKYGFSDAIAKPYEIGELSEVLHRVIMGASK